MAAVRSASTCPRQSQPGSMHGDWSAALAGAIADISSAMWSGDGAPGSPGAVLAWTSDSSRLNKAARTYEFVREPVCAASRSSAEAENVDAVSLAKRWNGVSVQPVG